MDEAQLKSERQQILDELAELPAGTIVAKRINGREQPYLQWREGHSVRSRYLKAGERDSFAQQVERRRYLSARLKELDGAGAAATSAVTALGGAHEFETAVRTGKALRDRVTRVAGWQRRDSYGQLRRYLDSGPADRVCIVCGLRRTGKTTMMRQAIADILVHVPTETSSGGPVDRVIFTQPGMRYAQAKALVRSLVVDPEFGARGRRERRLAMEVILDDVRGRMLEDVVLFETSRALPPEQEAFKLEFAVGEFDMVVYDEAADVCDVYEIKHASTRNPAQRRFLTDAGCCATCERVVAPIRERVVLYRGPACVEDGITYLNVNDYLLGLG